MTAGVITTPAVPAGGDASLTRLHISVTSGILFRLIFLRNIRSVAKSTSDHRNELKKLSVLSVPSYTESCFVHDLSCSMGPGSNPLTSMTLVLVVADSYIVTQ